MTTYNVAQPARTTLAVVTLSGQIDRDAMEPLTAAYEQATIDNPQTILLDFGDVDYINSTGIALIVGLLGRARAEGRAVQACGLTPHYTHIFEITRLSDFISIYPDVDSAVAGTTTAEEKQL